MAYFCMLLLFGKCRRGQMGQHGPQGLQAISESSGIITVQTLCEAVARIPLSYRQVRERNSAVCLLVKIMKLGAD